MATYIEKEGVQVKMVTIQYAWEVFPHDNVATRWMIGPVRTRDRRKKFDFFFRKLTVIALDREGRLFHIKC